MTTSSARRAASGMPEPADLVSVTDLASEVPTRNLVEGDRDALRAVANWITTVVATPNKDLGRSGPVCPFVPGAQERRTLWLVAERTKDRSMADIVQLVDGYKELFLRTKPLDREGAEYKAIVVVFADLLADTASGFFGELLSHLQVRSYVEDGLVLGAFHEGNEGSAVYNSNFRPFRSPVPFLLIRRAVVTDWKFFLDDDEGLTRWAQRFGPPAVQALAEELRVLPWREGRTD
jgi:hypothetical protein